MTKWVTILSSECRWHLQVTLGTAATFCAQRLGSARIQSWRSWRDWHSSNLNSACRSVDVRPSSVLHPRDTTWMHSAVHSRDTIWIHSALLCKDTQWIHSAVHSRDTIWIHSKLQLRDTTWMHSALLSRDTPLIHSTLHLRDTTCICTRALGTEPCSSDEKQSVSSGGPWAAQGRHGRIERNCKTGTKLLELCHYVWHTTASSWHVALGELSDATSSCFSAPEGQTIW
jgi:hypothetical protein